MRSFILLSWEGLSAIGAIERFLDVIPHVRLQMVVISELRGADRACKGGGRHDWQQPVEKVYAKQSNNPRESQVNFKYATETKGM